MKKLRKILSLFLFLGVVLILSNTKSFAAEIQYTDNLIPQMTSDILPSGVASASSSYSAGYAPWRAFDKANSSETEAWVTGNGTVTGWLEYDFPEDKSITKYTIMPRGGAYAVNVQQIPKDWTFEAWDEQNNSWIILDTKSEITDWVLNTKKEFTFTNNESYKKYRINITANNGFTGHSSIGELEMMETVGGATTPDSSLKTVIEENESLQLSISDDLSKNANMMWSSSDTSIATVDSQGIVTGVKAGNAIITVVSADGTYSESLKFLVIESETEVAIDLKVGDTRRLTIDDLAGTTSATWTSDNQAVATVSSIGKVTAVTQGTTYVIVKDDQGNEIGKICVRVRN